MLYTNLVGRFCFYLCGYEQERQAEIVGAYIHEHHGPRFLIRDTDTLKLDDVGTAEIVRVSPIPNGGRAT